MNTDIQINSKIKVTDKTSPYYRWRGVVSAETLVAERIEGQPKPDVSSFLCTLHLDGKQAKVELKPEQIACIQKKFIDIEHIREEDIELGVDDFGEKIIRRSNTSAFEPGDIIQISEKIDGANASIAWNSDEDKIEIFSRTNLLEGADGLRGFKPYIETTFKPDEFKSYPDYVIFGEWCVDHKIHYGPGWRNTWKVYDIFDKSKKNYLPQSEVKDFCSKHNLEYIHALYEGPFISWEHCKSFMHANTYGDRQEGIVIKNQTKLDRDDIRAPKYLKIVNDEFKESMLKREKKPVDPEAQKAHDEALAKVESIVTEARVRKIILKCVDDGVVPAALEPKCIGPLMRVVPKTVYEDIIKEEPDVVKSIGPAVGKLCGVVAAKHVRKIILGQ